MKSPAPVLRLGLALVLSFLCPLWGGARAGEPPDLPEPILLQSCQAKADAFDRVFRERFGTSLARGVEAGFGFFALDLPPLYSSFSSPREELRMRLIRDRNPRRRADRVERAAMAGFSRAGADSGRALGLTVALPGRGRVFSYSREIRAEAACLACHGTGDRLSPEARELLEDRYPRDRAVGFREGEVMGAVSIRVGLGPARKAPPPASSGR